MAETTELLCAMQKTTPRLFQPVRVGDIKLAHRIALAPLTRFRSSDSHVPLPIVTEYYEQRGSVPGTLLITEGTFISDEASGYPNVPGLFTREQLNAWKKVTEAVHAKGSFIFAQLWALGRAAREDVLAQKGWVVKSSSAERMSDNSPVPVEMTEEDIARFVKAYASAAKAAVEIAGFDGVEIHGANGYLIDQFTQDNCNKRTDSWGGSIENRARFAIEVTRAVVAAVGAQRTGIRLSPWSTFQGMRMASPVPQFRHLILALKNFGLAYLHVVESRISGSADTESSGSLNWVLDAWGRDQPIIIAGGFNANSAKIRAERGDNVIIAFGRYFISTPDLPYRLKKGIALTDYDRSWFYTPTSEKGYIDYPFSTEFLKDTRARL